MFKVYLAGPIAGLDYAEAIEWRTDFKNHVYSILLNRGEDTGTIRCYSPMRSKEYLNTGEKLGWGYIQPMSTSKAIVTRDFNDVRTADLVVVNFLNAVKVSIGTVAEIAWAQVLTKPVMLVMEPEGNVHDHPFVTEHAGFRVESLYEAAQMVAHVLLP